MLFRSLAGLPAVPELMEKGIGGQMSSTLVVIGLGKSSGSFFIPIRVLRDKFRGKYMANLSSLYESGSLVFSHSCEKLRNSYNWKEWKNNLYEKEWCPYIKKTFNGFGNAIEYLGRYTHKIAISNSRILGITENGVTFSARGRKTGAPKRRIKIGRAHV